MTPEQETDTFTESLSAPQIITEVIWAVFMGSVAAVLLKGQKKKQRQILRKNWYLIPSENLYHLFSYMIFVNFSTPPHYLCL